MLIPDLSPSLDTEDHDDQLSPAVLLLHVLVSVERVCCLSYLLVGQSHSHIVEAFLKLLVIEVTDGVTFVVLLNQSLAKIFFLLLSLHPLVDFLVKPDVFVIDLVLNQALGLGFASLDLALFEPVNLPIDAFIAHFLVIIVKLLVVDPLLFLKCVSCFVSVLLA